MIAATLMANGATVHIVDYSKDDLARVRAIYSGKVGGRLILHEGDITKKAGIP